MRTGHFEKLYSLLRTGGNFKAYKEEILAEGVSKSSHSRNDSSSRVAGWYRCFRMCSFSAMLYLPWILQKRVALNKANAFLVVPSHPNTVILLSQFPKYWSYRLDPSDPFVIYMSVLMCCISWRGC